MTQRPYRISRSEGDLLRYFRSLPYEVQLELLNRAESSYQQVCRMDELALRNVERSFGEGEEKGSLHEV